MPDLRALDVRLHDRSVGSLTRLPNDQNVFVFDASYVDDTERATLSLSFKDSYGNLISQSRATQTRLQPFFSNLLPEEPLRSYLAKRANVKAGASFSLPGPWVGTSPARSRSCRWIWTRRCPRKTLTKARGRARARMRSDSHSPACS